ncbi:MAG: PmoA family protein [Bryobacteraceae bacterium]|nr:PmoA family protein [Bryobacteraceae bacterium]
MMTKTTLRRNFLRGAAGVALAPGAATAIDFDKPTPGSENLTAYLNGEQVMVRWNNIALCSYRAHGSLKYPYFGPVNGPVSGASLTTESALPYPHHRGLWLGCEPLNGGDYWGDNDLAKGQVRSVGLKLGAGTAKQVEILDRCEWVRAGAASPMEDERRFVITMVDERRWTLDAELTLKARETVTITKAKHSLFAIRVAPELAPIYGGTLMNSEGGVGAEATYGKPARWCGYHGKRATHGRPVEGLAVMNHPGNPWQPCPWFTRDYGHLSPSPFAFRKEPWVLEKGRAVTLRYRVVAHGGTPAEADLDGLYRSWAG